jgi:hypothetical protein
MLAPLQLQGQGLEQTWQLLSLCRCYQPVQVQEEQQQRQRRRQQQ